MENNKLFKNFKFIVSLIWETSPRFLCMKVLSIVVNTVSPFILILFPKYIIDSIINENGFHTTFSIILSMCLCLLVVNALSTYIGTYINKYSGIIQFDLVKLYGRKVMELNYEDLENPSILDMFEKSKTGFDLYGFFDKIVSIISNLFTLIGYSVILFTYNWLMLLIVLLVVAVNLFCNKQKNKYYYKMSEESAPINRKFTYLVNLMLGFDYAKEIKVNNLSTYITEKYDSNLVWFKKILTKIYNKLLIYTGISSLVSILQTLVLYSVVAYSTIMKSITIGDFTMYIAAISAASASMLEIVVSFADINQNMKYATDMRLFFELERKTEKSGVKPAFNSDNLQITFKNVSFRYPGTQRWALHNVNFTVRKGEKISIVGTNGSGKTTLIKLLLRLYEPTEGEIIINGINIDQYDYTEYIDLFAPVLQDYKIFAFSCKENVVLNREYDEQKLYKALYDSGLEEKIARLPEGVMTSVYKLFDENGVEFSGGENQRLAIARAIYKDAPVILLDEPTANLDPLAEYDIYITLYKMLNDKTSFFVSHRLASSRFCDRIFVLNDGELISDGSHDELMKKCDLYREMFDKQSQYYVNKECNKS